MQSPFYLSVYFSNDITFAPYVWTQMSGLATHYVGKIYTFPPVLKALKKINLLITVVVLLEVGPFQRVFMSIFEYVG